jgi:hypothetical protein
MTKTTERFQRELKDLKEVMTRGGLAQDTTMREKLQTEQAMITKVVRIGKEDGMTKDEVKAALRECYTKPVVSELENLTLYDALHSILYDLDPDKQGAIDDKQITADFPQDKELAGHLLVIIYEKYQACTEEERRSITRSDAEFYYIVGTAIALRCGFKDIQDAFGIDTSRLDIPKIKRSKELFWSALGDPDPIISPRDQAFRSKMHELMGEIIANFSELYPDLYAKIKDNYINSRVVLNISHKDEVDILYRLSEKSDLREFKSFAIPPLVDAVVMSFLIQKKFYMNNHKRKSIRKTLIESVLKEETSYVR